MSHALPAGSDPFEEVVSHLVRVTRTARGVRALCPVHEGPASNPSLDVDRGDDGRVLLTCRSKGCSAQDIVTALGLPLSVLSPGVGAGQRVPGRREVPRKTNRFDTADEVARWLGGKLRGHRQDFDYYAADGQHVGRVSRFDGEGGGKSYRQASWDGSGWVAKAMLDPRPLYRLPGLVDSADVPDPVFVTEGEKCAEAVVSLGLIATTPSQGAQSPGKSDWSPLRGRQVVVLPDCDDPGRKFAASVVDLLRQAGAAKVAVLELDGLSAGEDVVEWIEAQASQGHQEADIATRLYELASSSLEAEASVEFKPLRELTEKADYRPFPLCALPDSCRAIVEEGADATGVDPSFYAVPLLAILGGCVGNARWVEAKRGWEEPAVIWAAVIAPSGSGKTPPLTRLLKPIRRHERELNRQNAKAREDYERRLRALDKKGAEEPPEEPRVRAAIVDDFTMEVLMVRLLDNPRGLLLTNDELAAFFRGMNRYRKGDDLQKWLRIFSADQFKVDRKGGAQRPGESLLVPSAAVSVVGTIQNKIAEGFFSGEELASGLIARFLLAMPPTRARQWTEKTVSREAEDGWSRTVDALLNLAPGGEHRCCLTLSPEAQDLFVPFFDASNRELHEAAHSGPAGLAEALSKLLGYCLRLALLIHLVREAERGRVETTRVIDRASMEAAIQVAAWFQGEARRFYMGKRGGKPGLHDKVQALLSDVPMSVGQINQALSLNYSKDELLSVLRELESRGLAKFCGSGSSGPKGGRPSPLWSSAFPEPRA